MTFYEFLILACAFAAVFFLRGRAGGWAGRLSPSTSRAAGFAAFALAISALFLWFGFNDDRFMPAAAVGVSVWFILKKCRKEEGALEENA